MSVTNNNMDVATRNNSTSAMDNQQNKATVKSGGKYNKLAITALVVGIVALGVAAIAAAVYGGHAGYWSAGAAANIPGVGAIANVAVIEALTLGSIVALTGAGLLALRGKRNKALDKIASELAPGTAKLVANSKGRQAICIKRTDEKVGHVLDTHKNFPDLKALISTEATSLLPKPALLVTEAESNQIANPTSNIDVPPPVSEDEEWNPSMNRGFSEDAAAFAAFATRTISQDSDDDWSSVATLDLNEAERIQENTSVDNEDVDDNTSIADRLAPGEYTFHKKDFVTTCYWKNNDGTVGSANTEQGPKYGHYKNWMRDPANGYTFKNL